MSSQNISIFRIQLYFFGGTNINLSKIILIDPKFRSILV